MFNIDLIAKTKPPDITLILVDNIFFRSLYTRPVIIL